MLTPFKMKGWSPFTQKSEFEKAFAAAREKDDDEFTYDGKKYHTGTKEEKETGTGYFDPHAIQSRKTGGLREDARAIRKAKCAKKGGTWNSATHSCE